MNYLLLTILIIFIIIICLTEFRVINKIEPFCQNFILPTKKAEEESKTKCCKKTADNYQAPTMNKKYRCTDREAANFEPEEIVDENGRSDINQKLGNDAVCQYVDNDKCHFPVHLSNVNSFVDIVGNSAEIDKLIDENGINNYYLLPACGDEMRSRKLDLFHRLFLPYSLKRNEEGELVIEDGKVVKEYHRSPNGIGLNVWDFAGKVEGQQFTNTYKRFYGSPTFDSMKNKIQKQSYGFGKIPETYYQLQKLAEEKNLHIALAISSDFRRYAIGMSPYEKDAMEIALLRCNTMQGSRQEAVNKWTPNGEGIFFIDKDRYFHYKNSEMVLDAVLKKIDKKELDRDMCRKSCNKKCNQSVVLGYNPVDRENPIATFRNSSEPILDKYEKLPEWQKEEIVKNDRVNNVLKTVEQCEREGYLCYVYRK